MGWNEPGGNGSGNNPWGKKNQGPPDLDEVIKNLHQKFMKMFGGGQGGPTFQEEPKGPKAFLFSLLCILVLIIWGLSGIYFVEPQEKAIVKRFGKFHDEVGSGLNWIPRFIDTRTNVNIMRLYNIKISGQMLTKDENIVDAELAVQYRVNSPKDFLFNVVKPHDTIYQISESALRSVVGQSTLDEILTSGRAEISEDILHVVTSNVEGYRLGLVVDNLVLQRTKAPDEVKAAFDDAIKAAQDEERLVNEGEAYARKRIPIAQGKSKRILEEAMAYKQEVILLAQGNVAQFKKLLPEYQAAPKVTQERLYLDTLSGIFKHTNKVIVDVEGGNSLMYLPIDKMIQGQPLNRAMSSAANAQSNWEQQSDSAGEVAPKTSRSSRRVSERSASRGTRSSFETQYGTRGANS